MKILVIGSGGREHALAWRLAQSPRVEKVYVAPGNAGTADTPNLENLAISDLNELADFATSNDIAFTVVGPEAPLAKGVVNIFRDRGLKIFGPTKEAAQLESSKDFAKAFMKRHGIPTAEYETFTDVEAAHAYVRHKGAPIVIKADGLAAGKGVVVAMTEEDAHEAVDFMLQDNKLGDAGARIVIEDYLDGEEASFIVMVDGEHVLPMATSQDHKRLLDNDEGPNTGGMGAFSPSPNYTPAIAAECMEKIFLPTVAALKAEGRPFQGVIYFGLMLTKSGPKVVEYNCRFGDPETQVVLPLLKSDLLTVMRATTDGTLAETPVEFSDKNACCVIVASKGYPVAYEKGYEIDILDEIKDSVYVAGAAEKKRQARDERWQSSRRDGGRRYASGGNSLGIRKGRKNSVLKTPSTGTTSARKALAAKGGKINGIQSIRRKEKRTRAGGKNPCSARQETCSESRISPMCALSTATMRKTSRPNFLTTQSAPCSPSRSSTLCRTASR